MINKVVRKHKLELLLTFNASGSRICWYCKHYMTQRTRNRHCRRMFIDQSNWCYKYWYAVNYSHLYISYIAFHSAMQHFRKPLIVASSMEYASSRYFCNVRFWFFFVGILIEYAAQIQKRLQPNNSTINANMSGESLVVCQLTSEMNSLFAVQTSRETHCQN